jgi:cephalosporin hydroxylase
LDPIEEFNRKRENNIRSLGEDARLNKQTLEWIRTSSAHNYTYNFTWMGLPVIQFPQDLIAVQEIVWETGPDLIIETGIARGGSLVFYASLLELAGRDGQVVGIDIDIREHNRRAIESHPMFSRITMIEGSSVADEVIEKVVSIAEKKPKVMVVLDSNHTHEHVLRELELYSPLVSRGCYLLVFDTTIEKMPEDMFMDRAWDKGNNPWTAVREFLEKNDSFQVDKSIPNKLAITVAIDGYLRRVK